MTTHELIVPERQSLDAYLPKTGRDVLWMANEVAKAGIYMNGSRPMSGPEVFVVMMKGAELGLTPLQSLNEIYLIKGKPVVSKDVLTARIVRSPRVVQWDPSDASPTHCTIKFQIRGADPTSLTTKIEDIPQRYFAPSRNGEPSNWTLIPEDMLYSWTVRRVARRWVPEALLDIGPSEDTIDETKVIDVAKVERYLPADGERSWPCSACGSGRMYLQASTRGGVYLRCNDCNATDVPPPEVRDLVRNTPPSLTIAATDRHSTEAAAGDSAASPSPETLSLPDPEPSPTGVSIAEPAPDVPEDAAENGAGSPAPETHTLDEAAAGDSAASPFDTTTTPVLPDPEPAAAPAPASDSGSPSTIDATAAETPPETREAEPAPLTPRDQVRAYLRKHRSATGPHKIAIRDALLDAGWDGTTGISQLCDELSDDKLATLLEAFARPGFGTVQ